MPKIGSKKFTLNNKKSFKRPQSSITLPPTYIAREEKHNNIYDTFKGKNIDSVKQINHGYHNLIYKLDNKTIVRVQNNKSKNTKIDKKHNLFNKVFYPSLLSVCGEQIIDTGVINKNLDKNKPVEYADKILTHRDEKLNKDTKLSLELYDKTAALTDPEEENTYRFMEEYKQKEIPIVLSVLIKKLLFSPLDRNKRNVLVKRTKNGKELVIENDFDDMYDNNTAEQANFIFDKNMIFYIPRVGSFSEYMHTDYFYLKNVLKIIDGVKNSSQDFTTEMQNYLNKYTMTPFKMRQLIENVCRRAKYYSFNITETKGLLKQFMQEWFDYNIVRMYTYISYKYYEETLKKNNEKKRFYLYSSEIKNIYQSNEFKEFIAYVNNALLQNTMCIVDYLGSGLKVDDTFKSLVELCQNTKQNNTANDDVITISEQQKKMIKTIDKKIQNNKPSKIDEMLNNIYATQESVLTAEQDKKEIEQDKKKTTLKANKEYDDRSFSKQKDKKTHHNVYQQYFKVKEMIRKKNEFEPIYNAQNFTTKKIGWQHGLIDRKKIIVQKNAKKRSV